ncbi:hypothetical protein B0H21DRAFT_265022 [Amylocystis lapponica]|nr:hypothetical protein B0H21DRAFT_265022 [Amylocystis lapponica]
MMILAAALLGHHHADMNNASAPPAPTWPWRKPARSVLIRNPARGCCRSGDGGRLWVRGRLQNTSLVFSRQNPSHLDGRSGIGGAAREAASIAAGLLPFLKSGSEPQIQSLASKYVRRTDASRHLRCRTRDIHPAWFSSGCSMSAPGDQDDRSGHPADMCRF